MARSRPLQCPYCDNYLRGPIELNIKGTEVTGGICPCGSVYVLDRTGHNLGEVFYNALIFVSRGDVDKALALGPEDYDSVDYDYDANANTTGRSAGCGKLLFVKLK